MKKKQALIWRPIRDEIIIQFFLKPHHFVWTSFDGLVLYGLDLFWSYFTAMILKLARFFSLCWVFGHCASVSEHFYDRFSIKVNLHARPKPQISVRPKQGSEKLKVALLP